jgi:hypothetical protein
MRVILVSFSELGAEYQRSDYTARLLIPLLSRGETLINHGALFLCLHPMLRWLAYSVRAAPTFFALLSEMAV